MNYRLLLGGERIDGVTAVAETARRDIREYLSIGGAPFCQDRGRSLRFWQVRIELCLYDSQSAGSLLSRLRDMGKSSRPQLLSVSWDMGGFSARVLLREMETDAISGEACAVTLGLLEYARPAVSTAESGRAGSPPDPPQLTAAHNAYLIITKYQRAGETVRVKNPSTGVDISNLAAIDGDAAVRLEREG